MKFILTLILSVFVTNCSILQNKQERLKGWNLFSLFEIDKDTEENVKKVLGNPSDIYNIKSKDKNKKIEQWTYFREGMSTIRIIFTNSLVQYIFMDVWEGEDVQVLSYLLDKFPGKWKIAQEEPISAHFMPRTCYLTDKALGKRIEIDGYKKVVESISKENPNLD